MSDALSWQDRVTQAARHTPQRPYEDNETSCRNLDVNTALSLTSFSVPSEVTTATTWSAQWHAAGGRSGFPHMPKKA